MAVTASISAVEALPPGMGIITGVGGIFTRTWMLMGYEHFSLSLADNPEVADADKAPTNDPVSPSVTGKELPSTKPANPADTAAKGPEITVIIDEKTPGSQKKVIVIPRASQWLLEMLTGENPGDKPVASYPSER